MIESKIEATHRLQREGRWQEASLFRDQKRRLFREEGKLRQEAGELSWAAMIAQYPPLISDDAANKVTAPDIVAMVHGDDDYEALPLEIEWVSDNLSEDNLTADDFPSLGAWSLWTWARENRERFFNGVWARTGEVRAQQHPTYDEEEEEVAENRAYWVALLAEDLQGALRKRIANELREFTTRFDLEEAPEKYVGELAERVMELADVANSGAPFAAPSA